METGFFSRHERAMLFFSSGKDSAACLQLLKPYWGRFDVVWCNMGNPYPETVEYMKQIRAEVPRFVELKGNQPETLKKLGYPVDALPISTLPFSTKFTPFTQCCGANFWGVMLRYIVENKITGVIKGQKLADKMRSTANSGFSAFGVEIWHPLETWADADVRAYLGKNIPDSYKRGNMSSLDCINCTAYLAENGPRLLELKEKFPGVYSEVSFVLKEWKKAVNPALEVVNGLA